MTHDELRDLLGAYLLDALSLEERAEVDAHLQTCADCRAVVQDLVPVPEHLALLADDREPPPALRTRLLAIAEAERREWLQAPSTTVQPLGDHQAGTGAERPDDQVPAPSGGSARREPPGQALPGHDPWARLRDWLRGTPRLALSGAAALVVVIVAVGVILARRPTLTVRTYACAALQPTLNGIKLADTGCSVRVRSDHTIDLAFTSLPALSATKAYELWALPAKGNPVPIAGFATTHTRSFQHTYAIDARQYPKAAISIERAPGDSAMPHGPVIFVVPLTS